MRTGLVHAAVPALCGLLLAAHFNPLRASAQTAEGATYAVIRTRDFVATANPRPGERMRVDILGEKERAHNINGIFGSIPPRLPGAKPAYHYHTARESIIQVLSGDATEMVDGTPIPLQPGDVIFIRPRTRHTMMNNSQTQEVKYMEFFSPIAADTVQAPQ